jgi:hypothetical protein
MASTIFKPLPHGQIAASSAIPSNTNGLSLPTNASLGLGASTPMPGIVPSLLNFGNPQPPATYNWAHLLQLAAASRNSASVGGIFGIPPPCNWPLFAETASASAVTPFTQQAMGFGSANLSNGGLLQACAPSLSSPEQA